MTNAAIQDLVIKNEILKAQVLLEDKARRDWKRKWSFFLDFDKFCLEEAAKKGISQEQYRKMTQFRKHTTRITNDPGWEIKSSDSIPVTSSDLKLNFGKDTFRKVQELRKQIIQQCLDGSGKPQ